MSDPVAKWLALGNIGIYMMDFKRAGDEHVGYPHTYAHPSIVARGAADVISNGIVDTFDEKNRPIAAIAPGVQHHIVAKEDNTRWLCVHAFFQKDNPGDIIDPDMVPKGTPPWTLAMPLLQAESRKLGFINVFGGNMDMGRQGDLAQVIADECRRDPTLFARVQALLK